MQKRAKTEIKLMRADNNKHHIQSYLISGNITDKDYRMWFKLNCKTRISVVTSVGESDAARIFDRQDKGALGQHWHHP